MARHDLPLTRRLVNVLLDELHVTDEFDRLVGPTTRVPVSQLPTADCGRVAAAPQLVALRPLAHERAHRARVRSAHGSTQHPRLRLRTTPSSCVPGGALRASPH